MSPEREPRLLFVTSNGTGLGHLTRSLAIARRLPGGVEPLFVTFSAAAPVVRELGFPVEYVASYDRPGAGNDLTWTWRTRERLRALTAEARPSVVMFDGTHPYERLLPALRASGAALVWCRRAMWRPGADTAPLHRSHLFDAILEPGEAAAEADAGPTAARRQEAVRVGPIVLLDRSELLPRAEAERELGLAPGRLNVLVQLGQGEGVAAAAERCLRHLAAVEGVQVAAPASTLAGLAEPPPGVVRLGARYPIGRYLAAFDAAIAAAGYNAFHELLELGPPALFVPMERQTDDQAARARFAAARGLALAAAGPDDPGLERLLGELLDAGRRQAIASALGAARGASGAAEAARWLAGLAHGHPAPRPGSQRRGSPEAAGAPAAPAPRPPAASLAVRLRRWWIFVASVPSTILRIVRQTLTRPRTRAVVLDFGHADGAAAERALAALGERPERVLVVTDRLDFRALLAAGVGFEHIPAEGERQAQLAGVPYDEFRRRRLDLILARRPRRRRIVPAA